MIMISFSLLVVFQKENRSGDHLAGNSADNSLANYSSSSSDRTSKPRAIERPSRKSFRTNYRTTNPELNNNSTNEQVQLSGFAVPKQDELESLPEFDFQEMDPVDSTTRTVLNPETSNQQVEIPNSNWKGTVDLETPKVQPPVLTNPEKPDYQISDKGKSRKPQQTYQGPINLAPAVTNSFLQKVRYANSLARRGAVSTAFEELKGSLKLFAEAIDQIHQTQEHSKAVHAGLVALQEVSDFAHWGNDLSLFVAGHDTEVLRDRDLENLTFHEARLAYLSYVEEQLRRGCQNHPLAGETFRSLGKVFLMMDEYTRESKMSQAKAMLMFRLATEVNPQDAVAAKELGILYAKYNHFKNAKELLIQSLQVRNEANTWNALSGIHKSLGEISLAQSAMNEARIAANRQQKKTMVYWTNPSQFNQLGSMVDPPIMTAQRPVANSGSATPRSQPNQNIRR